MPNKEDWDSMTKDELEKKARDLGISGHSSMKKEELVRALEKHGSGGGSRRD